MKPAVAISALEALKAEAPEPATVAEKPGDADSWKIRIYTVLARSLGKDHHLVTMMENLEWRASWAEGSTPTWDDELTGIRWAVGRACGYIDAAIYELRLDDTESLEVSGHERATADVTALDPDRARKVFVIHGRNELARSAMFTFLRSLSLSPIEWSEALAMTGEASPFIGHVLDVALGAAQAIVVLMTPDDVAYLRSEYANEEDDPDTTPLGQARPNVLFEAGMAMGRDPKRTVLVELGWLRPFSDVAGRYALRMADTPQRRAELAQRLHTAGCDVNTTGQDWLTAGDFVIPPPPTAPSLRSTDRARAYPARKDPSPTEHDKELFKRFASTVPSDGIPMRWLKQQFSPESLPREPMHALEAALRKLDLNPIGFDDRSVNAAYLDLRSTIETFGQKVKLWAVADARDTSLSVPEEWRFENKPKYQTALTEIQEAHDAVVASYDKLLNTCHQLRVDS